MAMGMGGTGGVGPAGAAGKSAGARGALSKGPGGGNTGPNIAGNRPDRIAMNLDFVTPSYDWSQANLGNFGIGGAIANMFKGIAAGNTYNQGMPKGFVGGQSMGSGNANAGQMFMPGGFIGVNRAAYMADTKGAPKMFMPQPQMAGASQQQQLKPLTMGFTQGANLATGGKFGSSMFRPGYNFIQAGA